MLFEGGRIRDYIAPAGSAQCVFCKNQAEYAYRSLYDYVLLFNAIGATGHKSYMVACDKCVFEYSLSDAGVESVKKLEKAPFLRENGLRWLALLGAAALIAWWVLDGAAVSRAWLEFSTLGRLVTVALSLPILVLPTIVCVKLTGDHLRWVGAVNLALIPLAFFAPLPAAVLWMLLLAYSTRR